MLSSSAFLITDSVDTESATVSFNCFTFTASLSFTPVETFEITLSPAFTPPSFVMLGPPVIVKPPLFTVVSPTFTLPFALKVTLFDNCTFKPFLPSLVTRILSATVAFSAPPVMFNNEPKVRLITALSSPANFKPSSNVATSRVVPFAVYLIRSISLFASFSFTVVVPFSGFNVNDTPSLPSAPFGPVKPIEPSLPLITTDAPSLPFTPIEPSTPSLPSLPTTPKVAFGLKLKVTLLFAVFFVIKMLPSVLFNDTVAFGFTVVALVPFALITQPAFAVAVVAFNWSKLTASVPFVPFATL